MVREASHIIFGFLKTSIEITELKFLTHECLLSKSMIADQ